MSSVRTPAVAGRFYEKSATALTRQIEESFRHDHGPGEIPDIADGPPDVRALVSPHAGYSYSGPVAAHGFAELAASGTPDAAIILGPNHDGLGEPAALSAADRWATPLGEVRIHDDLRERIAGSSEIVSVDERTHDGEHSMEVQVPFLQYVYDDSVPIVPLCLTHQDESTVESVSRALVDAADAFDGDVVFVASTDMTHYRSPAVAEKQDRMAIDEMESLDGSALLKTVTRERISMCGYGPTAAVLEAAKGLGATDGTLLKYATSGDIAGPAREVVGYASVVVR
ncbi:MAG: AmmeMemoRadiSam system protein B [Halodesulfurarchaeum sp.]